MMTRKNNGFTISLWSVVDGELWKLFWLSIVVSLVLCGVRFMMTSKYFDLFRALLIENVSSTSFLLGSLSSGLRNV